jgi:hypothetical protein
MSQVLVSAVLFGLVLIPITYIAGFFSKMITQKPTLPEICSTWNQYYIMEFTLFIAGFLMHLLLHFTGAYEWYVKPQVIYY